MRAFALTSWLSVIAWTVTAVGGTYVICPGCIDRSRGNSRCEWTRDRRLQLDVQDRAHWRHLVADAQLAEEVAVRSGDAEYPRRYRVGAGDLHERNAQAQVACLARLNAVIEDLHGVTSLQRTSANRQRNALFDSLVVLSFLPMYIFGIQRVCERFGGVLRADARSVRVSAVAIGSIIYSAVGLVAFRPWWASMKGMRVGNPDGHFGFRAAAENYWSLAFVASWLAVGAILFWSVAFAFRRVEDSRSSADDTTLTNVTA